MSDATRPTSVYQYYDSVGRILYVGVTARGIRRAHEHAETKEWWPLCTGCAIEHYPTREAALTREEQLIKRYLPPFNTVHNAFRDEAKALYYDGRGGLSALWRDRDETLDRAESVLRDAHDRRMRESMSGEQPTDLTPDERERFDALINKLDVVDASIRSVMANTSNTYICQQGLSPKEARRRWHELPAKLRASEPCVTCGQRPPVRGPNCLMCHAPNKDRTLRYAERS